MRKNDLSILTPRAQDSMERLLSLYDERIYEWMAGLWEPEIGGFYYSNSARDHEHFLPDIESTVQVIRFLQKHGIAEKNGTLDLIPDWMREKLLGFAKGLQYEDDGFFYHPQWGKDIIASRKGRDNSWALSLLKDFGEEPLYTPGAERIKGAESVVSVPEYITDRKKLYEYLESFDISVNSYRMGNDVGSQMTQIIAAGNADVVMDYYNKHQNPENGTWHGSVCYAASNGAMKISGTYAQMKMAYPNAELAARSVMEALVSDEMPGGIVDTYNPWATVLSIIESLRAAGDYECAERIKKYVHENAHLFIDRTADKVALYKKDDGSFSYRKNSSTNFGCLSQNAPVGIGCNEGDVNGTCLASSGPVNRICWILGLDVKFYDDSDSRRFYELLGKARVPEKKPIPAGLEVWKYLEKYIGRTK